MTPEPDRGASAYTSGSIITDTALGTGTPTTPGADTASDGIPGGAFAFLDATTESVTTAKDTIRWIVNLYVNMYHSLSMKIYICDPI